MGHQRILALALVAAIGCSGGAAAPGSTDDGDHDTMDTGDTDTSSGDNAGGDSAPQAIVIAGTFATVRGVPRAPVAIRVWSAGLTNPIDVNSAADGTFSLTGVVAPYDLLFVTPGTGGGDDGQRLLVTGLTRTDPLIVDSRAPGDSQSATQYSVHASSPTYPNGALWTAIDAQCARAFGSVTTTYGTTMNSELTGPVAPGESCKLSILHLTTTNDGLPTAYEGAVTTAPVGDITLTLATLPTHQVSARATSELGEPTLVWTWLPGARGTYELYNGVPAGDAVMLAIPDDAETYPMAVRLYATGTTDDAPSVEIYRHLGAAAETLDIALPQAITVTSSAAAIADLNADTSITIAGAAQATYLYDVPTDQGTVRVVTNAARITMRALVDHGFALAPSSGSVSIGVTAYDQVATTDAWAVGIGDRGVDAATVGLVTRKRTLEIE